MRYKHEKNRFKEEHGKRKRIRAVAESTDFMRVEDAGQMPGLDPFELEVKKEMASLSKTPTDELIAREDTVSKHIYARASKWKFKRLIRMSALPRQMRLVYELSYVCKLPEREIADLLEITEVTVRRFRLKIPELLMKRIKRRAHNLAVLRRASFVRLTKNQWRIVRLYYRNGFTGKEIGAMLGRAEQSVMETLRRAQTKIFPE